MVMRRRYAEAALSTHGNGAEASTRGDESHREGLKHTLQWTNAFALLAGIGIGALLMYFFDPGRGTRRLHMASDQTASSLREAARRLRDQARARAITCGARPPSSVLGDGARWWTVIRLTKSSAYGRRTLSRILPGMVPRIVPRMVPRIRARTLSDMRGIPRCVMAPVSQHAPLARPGSTAVVVPVAAPVLAPPS